MSFIIIKDKRIAVDDDDYEFLSSLKFSISQKGYVTITGGVFKGKKLHRVLMKAPRGMEVDHINHDPLDNRRNNLRICTRSQNHWNTSMHKTNKCSYKGVSFHVGTRKYEARIRVNNKKMFLGYFSNPKDAAAAYDNAASTHFGNYAFLNRKVVKNPAR